MTPRQFIDLYKQVELTERSACQSHFNDLCEVLGHQPPVKADPKGEWFTFERGVTTPEGKRGFADVWRKDRFGWEYKKKRANLVAAYEQLLKYRESLQNPPLLIVCDMNRFEIHTNWPNTVKEVHEFALDDLADPKTLAKLRSAFTSPDELKPGTTQEQVTEAIATEFAALADGLRARAVAPDRAAHFLVRLIFCMFAEDVGLLPRDTFTDTVKRAGRKPKALSAMLRDLFAKMADGGYFGATEIAHFNGGLFNDAEVFDLTVAEIDILSECARHDWSQIEPSIFGTLFERSLDPDKRAQLGAFYTSKADIETILQPVFQEPLEREWDDARDKMQVLWKRVQAEVRSATSKKGASRRARKAFDDAVIAFRDRLRSVVVLDPACGSGNFLYLALKVLLDLEKDLWEYASARDLTWFPQIDPTQLRGLEINPYARELARVVVWIGYLQWVKFNGFGFASLDPVLGSMEEIRELDAILDVADPDEPREPDWPEAEFIVGNPPFLGGKLLRSKLGDEYVNALFKLYGDRLPNFSDLCCYWFEKAREMIAAGRVRRAGLLATQGIRGGANRAVLDRIKETGDIFFAVGDRDWVLDGATVHISMVGFDAGVETNRTLDGSRTTTINPNLSTNADTTAAGALPASCGLSFIGVQKSGPFDVPLSTARTFLTEPAFMGRLPSAALRVYWTAEDVVRRPQDTWIIYFEALEQSEAELFPKLFAWLRERVPGERTAKHFAEYPFWLTWRPRGEMYAALRPLSRFIVTPHVSKHRVFAWAEPCVCPSNLLIAIAKEDDASFGVLHSRVHEVWARSMGTQLRERESGFRYTPTTCFETFPFPEPRAGLAGEIGAAAKDLNTQRENWLNPPEWTKTEVLQFPGSARGPWGRYIASEDIAPGIGTVRYPRTLPKDTGCAESLRARTLTNLYNARPTWLQTAHRKLDELVLGAYGLKPDITDDELLAKLLELNLADRSGQTGSTRAQPAAGAKKGATTSAVAPG